MQPLSRDELKALSPSELEEYERDLDALYWEKGKGSFRDFCTRVEELDVSTTVSTKLLSIEPLSLMLPKHARVRVAQKLAYCTGVITACCGLSVFRERD